MNITQTTDQIAEAMRADMPPWRKPTILHPNAGFPTNAYTNREYSGTNTLLLNMASMKRGFRSKYWATYKQWVSLGCKVKNRPDDVPDGEWATQITRMEGNEDNDARVPKTVFVFNADQVYGNFHLKPASAYQVLLHECVGAPEYAKVDALLESTSAEFRVGNYKQPRYEPPPKDYICMPWRKRFRNDQQWYGSKLHELIHWSEWRTGWRAGEAQNELIAEIGQGYLETLLGVPHCDDRTNHQKWLNVWLEEMAADPRYIYQSAAQAEVAVDFVMGRVSPRLQ